MIINQDILRRDTVQLLAQINAQIEEVRKEAERQGVAPIELRDEVNNWPMIPLLQAKAQAYSSLVQLQAR